MRIRDLKRQFKHYCLIELGITQRGYKEIIRIVDLLTNTIGIDETRNITEIEIRDFMYSKSSERCWSPKTFTTYLQCLNTFFRWCHKNKIIKENPVRSIERPKLPKNLPRFLTKEEVCVILSRVTVFPWYYKNERIRNTAILNTFLYTGIRLQELINLETRDVDLDNMEILIRMGKGKKDRIVPIHPSLAVILRTYVREVKSTLGLVFFPSIRSDKKLTPKNVRAICNRLSRSTRIKFTPHMLRHTFARLSVEADLNIYKLKEIMGHSDISTTQRYMSVSKEKIKQSFNVLELV